MQSDMKDASRHEFQPSDLLESLETPRDETHHSCSWVGRDRHCECNSSEHLANPECISILFQAKSRHLHESGEANYELVKSFERHATWIPSQDFKSAFRNILCPVGELMWLALDASVHQLR